MLGRARRYYWDARMSRFDAIGLWWEDLPAEKGAAGRAASPSRAGSWPWRGHLLLIPATAVVVVVLTTTSSKYYYYYYY